MGKVIRACASAGVSVLPGNERTSQNRFTGVLGAAGSFDSRYLPLLNFTPARRCQS